MERHVKGLPIKVAFDYIGANFPPAEGDKIIASLDPALVALVPDLKPTAWYPLSYWVAIFDAVVADQTVAAGEERLKLVGGSVANEALGSFLKLLLKILTPSLFANKFDVFWRKYHDFGDLRVVEKDIEHSHIVFSLDLEGQEYPHVHISAGAWIECAFRAMGKNSTVVTATNATPGQRVVMPEIIWDVRW
jgi:hypothetical protein